MLPCHSESCVSDLASETDKLTVFAQLKEACPELQSDKAVENNVVREPSPEDLQASEPGNEVDGARESSTEKSESNPEQHSSAVSSDAVANRKKATHHIPSGKKWKTHSLC